MFIVSAKERQTSITAVYNAHRVTDKDKTMITGHDIARVRAASATLPRFI